MPEVTEQRSSLRERMSERTIGPQSPIQLALVVGFLSVCAGGFGGSIWWASAISTKLDVVISLQKAQESINSTQNARITQLETWREVIDSAGSKATSKRLDDITLRLNEVKRELELHEAKTVGKPPPSS